MNYTDFIHYGALSLGILCLVMLILTGVVGALSERRSEADEERYRLMARFLKAACLLLIVSGVWRD